MKQELTIGGRKCRLFGADHPVCMLVQPSPGVWMTDGPYRFTRNLIK